MQKISSPSEFCICLFEVNMVERMLYINSKNESPQRRPQIQYGRVEKQGKLFGYCGMCHQPDADETFERKKEYRRYLETQKRNCIFMTYRHRKRFFFPADWQTEKEPVPTSGYAAAELLFCR